MLRFGLAAIWLVFLASILTLAGAHVMGAALFILPVAIYWVRGRYRRALGLIACAALVPVVLGIGVVDTLLFLLVAHVGVLLGYLALRRVSFGWCVAVLAGVGYAILIGMMASDWKESRDNATIVLAAQAEELVKVEKETGSAWAANMAEVFRTIDKHYEAIVFGSLFSTVYMLAVAAIAILCAMSPEGRGPIGSFRAMRPPDWLVWLLILSALAFLAYQQLGYSPLRVFAGNMALALAAVYWLNGLGILLHGLHALQAPWPLRVLMIAFVAVFYLHTQPIFWAFGLFDTWFDFRGKLDRLAQQRQPKNQ